MPLCSFSHVKYCCRLCHKRRVICTVESDRARGEKCAATVRRRAAGQGAVSRNKLYSTI